MTTRPFSRLVATASVLAVLTALSFTFGGAAQAQTACTANASYNPSATFAVSPTSVAAGGSVTFSGAGWPASSSVAITVGGASIGSATTNASGAFSFPYTVPAGTTLGSASASAGCGELVLSTNFTVTAGGTTTGGGGNANTSGSSGALPRTGSDNAARYAGVALALVCAGALLVFVSRKRQPATIAE